MEDVGARLLVDPNAGLGAPLSNVDPAAVGRDRAEAPRVYEEDAPVLDRDAYPVAEAD